MPYELMGATFTTPKDLRHLAEQEFGELFVPTDVHGRIVVHAERERHWYPYRIVHVEGPRENVRRAG